MICFSMLIWWTFCGGRDKSHLLRAWFISRMEGWECESGGEGVGVQNWLWLILEVQWEYLISQFSWIAV